MHKITVIGGGTGSFVLLSGLKKYELDLSAIVPATDSGGSTGRLRDEFGQLPVGDVRQCLVALADDEQSLLLRQLFNYRFDKGTGLKGHSVGNLLLTALGDILGSEQAAIDAAEQLLNVQGHIYPVALEPLNLAAFYADGSLVFSEHLIDEPDASHDFTQKIVHLAVNNNHDQPNQIKVNPAAVTAILESDMLLIGPGDLYTSIAANLVVPGISEAIKKSPAKLIYTVNLMSKQGQTVGMTASEHVAEVTKYAGRAPDYVLINSTPLPADILNKYAAEQDYPVVDDLSLAPHVLRTDLLAEEEITTPAGDILKRSLIRHSGDKIAQIVTQLLSGMSSN
jgi:uncharacterized cofD-like protein